MFGIFIIKRLILLLFLSFLFARQFSLSVGISQTTREEFLPQTLNGKEIIIFETHPFISPSISMETKV